MAFYANPLNVGLNKVSSLGDGTTINITWFRAYPSAKNTQIAYHIYYSTIDTNVYSEGVKYISIDGSLNANIIDLSPGQEYFFSVRPVEYDPSIFNLSSLPVAYDNLRVYPQSLLSQDISATDLIIPLLDVAGFPNSGVVKIGVELIQYASVDPINQTLIVDGGGTVFTNAQLVKQGNSYYSAPSTNVGSGALMNLTLVNTNVPQNNWQILCISVDRDSEGHAIAGTAKFGAVSDIFAATVGVEYTKDGYGLYSDGYGKPFIWTVNGPIVSNGVLSFSILETSTFKEGDYFLIKVAGTSTTVTAGGRGYAGTQPRIHTVGGFDGYFYWSPTVTLFTAGESMIFDRIYQCQSRFEYPNFPGTLLDGYKQVTTDYLSTDLSAADASNVNFPEYDYAGWHRTDPVQLLNGTCVGSYIGGELGCIDGYGNYNILRGFSLQDQITQREDVLLSVDGRDAILIQRVQTGIVCSCYLASSENQDDRCPFCYGTKFVFGYEQYFNPRYSNGRIKVRVSPTEESLKRYEAGLESEFPLDMWTLTVPTIKMRDVIVLFDQNGNEEFRYEVMGVTRNNTILGLQGGQHFKTLRVRKTDPIYQIRIFRDTSDFPSKLMTSVGFVPGIPPHTHEIVISEKIMSTSQINQTTALSQGHNHPIINGQVMEVLGHTHQIILP